MADEYGRGKTAKGNPQLPFPFNVKKTQPPPPPVSIYTPTPTGQTPNE